MNFSAVDGRYLTFHCVFVSCGGIIWPMGLPVGRYFSLHLKWYFAGCDIFAWLYSAGLSVFFWYEDECF